VGKHRRLLLVRGDLEGAKVTAHANGAKVNDVVLAAVAGGARRLLERRGELRPDLVLTVSVAASMRGPADEGASGNRVGIMLVPLPVGEADAVRRLEEIARATAERKRRPPYQPGGRFLQHWMVRAMFHQRLVNLLESNLPGPPVSVYFAGARVLELFQVGVVQGDITLSIGVLSYAGQLNFDIVADADAAPDLAVFSEGLSDALEQLGAGARVGPAARVERADRR
jgi:diacylglycerol O-acyltransferase